VQISFFGGITLGIYLPIWFLKRKDSFNRLISTEKIGSALPISIIVLFGVALFFFFMSGFLEGSDASTSKGFDGLGSIVNLIGSIMLLVMNFKGRRILIDHVNGHLQKQVPSSGLATFFFGVLYLQYKINRL